MVAPEFRYPDNETVPEYLRGKTASDAAQLLQGLVESVGRGQQAPMAQQPLPPAADDDYITQAHLRQAQQQSIAQVSPWLQTVADQQATMAYNIVEREQPDIFKKYAPEVIHVLQSVPRQNWTLDVVRKAVTMVKGSHVDEIAAEKVRALEMTMSSTMRSTGRAGLTSDSQTQDTVAGMLEKTPQAWRERAKAVGITDKQVWEYCQQNDIEPEEFFKQFGPGLVSDAIADVSYKRGNLG